MNRAYRVECNHGSKYFSYGAEALAYFDELREYQDGYIELWLLMIHERNGKPYTAFQELIAYTRAIKRPRKNRVGVKYES